MPVIHTSIANLIQGVSQQADSARYAGQCNEQENALSSVVDGLAKRPHTSHVAKLLDVAISSNSFVHFISRTDTERYVIIYNPDTHLLSAYNLITGVEASINGATGGLLVNNSDYIYDTNPRNKLKALTVGDTTFVLNTDATVAIDDVQKSPELAKEAFCFIKQGDYDKQYGVEIDSSFLEVQQTAILRLNLTSFILGDYKYYKVDTVTIIDGGSHYIPAATDLTTTAAAVAAADVNPNEIQTAIYEVPTFSFTTDDTGTITDVQVINGGRINKYNKTDTVANRSVNGIVSPPTGTATFSTEGTLTATITSGGSGGGSAAPADTTVIMSRLVSNASETNDFSDNDIDEVEAVDSKFTVEKSNNLAILTRKGNGRDFDIRGVDGLAGAGIGVGYKQVSAITDLPVYCKNGFVIKIVADTEASTGYYVKFQTANGMDFGTGTWVETIGHNIYTNINNATMPHQLVNTALNTFTFGAMATESRLVGDNDSNPFPSFVGKNINSIFLYQNRLGILANDNIIFSEAGLGDASSGELRYNFFRTTVTTTLDTDRIDIAVSSGRVTDLKNAIGFQDNLILFSDDSQFALKGGDILTPNTVSVSPITNFEADESVAPLALASYIYFPFKRGDFAGVREYSVTSDTDNYDAAEITEHIPAYIPEDLDILAGSTSEDMIIAHAPSTPKILYVYNYFWNNRKKLLSSWSKFILPFDVNGLNIFEGVLYMVGTKEGQTHALTLNLQSSQKDTGMDYATYLDMRKKVTLSDSTTVSFGYLMSAGDVLQVVDDEGAILKEFTGLNPITSIELDEAHTGDVFVGLKYTMKYVFSDQIFKAKAGQTTSPSAYTNIRLKSGTVFFNKSRGFNVKVQPHKRDEYINTYTPDNVSVLNIGDFTLEEGSFKFPIMSNNDKTTITIENDTPFPSYFTSADFEMFTSSRSRRYG